MGEVNEVLKLQGVSRITLEDRKLFEKFFRKSGKLVDFSNSWFYTVQSTIFGGFKYYDGETLIAFTTKKPRELPFAMTQYLGKNALEKAFGLGKKLRRTSKNKVIFKNLLKEQAEKMNELGCTDYKQKDCWNEHYKYDDDTFPETIIDLKKAVSLKGHELKRIRHYVSCFYKNNNYIVKNYSEKRNLKEASGLVKEWLALIKKRYGKHLKKDSMILHSAGIHQKFFELIHLKKAGNNHLAKIIHVNGKPHAATIGFKIAYDCIGLYTSITTDENIRGLSEANIFEFLKESFSQGYKYANLGGSEFQSLLNYKNKFKPCDYLQKTHRVLY